MTIALGLGTMVGWKRIVRTVGEKIGKAHLTYAQGASPEAVAMATIGAAHMFGFQSPPHRCSHPELPAPWPRITPGCSSTVRNLLMAWLLTLPIAIVLSGSLYWLFTHLF